MLTNSEGDVAVINFGMFYLILGLIFPFWECHHGVLSFLAPFIAFARIFILKDLFLQLMRLLNLWIPS